MVQIARAWAVDRTTGEGAEISARTVDKKRDADLDYFCPDKCCRIPLSHHKEHLHTFVDPDSGRAFKANVAAYFQRKPNGARHDDACTAVDAYTKYQIFARKNGGESHERGTFVFNLNIPTNTVPAPDRKRKSALTQKFQNRAFEKLTAQSQESAPSSERPAPQSQGLANVGKLAGLLEASAFNPKYRESVLLRDGPRLASLSEIYKDKPIEFYREEHARAKRGGPAKPVLVHFEPIAMGKFHSPHDLTIQGLAAPIRASNGKAKYAVSIQLHCGSKSMYDEIREQIRGGARSFLIYAPLAYVSLIELAHKKKEMEIGKPTDKAVFVHVRADRPEQIVRWTPPAAQLSFDLDTTPKPSRGEEPRLEA